MEVPAGIQTQVIVNGNKVLASAVSSPLSIRGHVVAPGEKSLAAAVMMGSLPTNIRAASEAVKIKDGVMFVPFEQLQVTKSVPVAGDVPATRALISIDETGHVIKVKPSAGAPAGIEESLQQWEFAPYMVDGQAVKVITIYAKKN